MDKIENFCLKVKLYWILSLGIFTFFYNIGFIAFLKCHRKIDSTKHQNFLSRLALEFSALDSLKNIDKVKKMYIPFKGTIPVR